MVRPFLARPVAKDLLEKNEPRFLYVSLAYRGDLILCFPAIRAIKRKFPKSKLTCWVKSYNVPLALMNPDIDEAISYDSYSSQGILLPLEFIRLARHRPFLETIRDRHFDCMVDEAGSGFSAMIGALARIPYRLGRNAQGYGFLHHVELPYEDEGHLVDRKVRSLAAMGISLEDFSELSPTIRVKAEEAQHAVEQAGIPSDCQGFFTVQPYSGWTAKEWSDKKFAEVVEKFGSVAGLTPVFIGSSEDVVRLTAVCSGINIECIIAAGKLELAETAALISRAQMHIGVDSLGSHVAAATGVKSLTLFGPTNPRLSAARNVTTVSIYKRIQCSPASDRQYCAKDAGRSCSNIECMKQLTVEEVMDALLKLWRGEVESTIFEV